MSETDAAKTELLPPCPICGYDLSASTTGQCPECGRPVYRFTERAREVARLAEEQAIRLLEERAMPWWLPRFLPSREIEPAHILLAICTGPDGIGKHSIRTCGIDPMHLYEYLFKRLPRGTPRYARPVSSRLYPSNLSREVISDAVEQAFTLGHNHTGTEHILLSLCKRGDAYARAALRHFDLRADKLREVVRANTGQQA